MRSTGSPDTEEFDRPLTSAALNAALSVGAMMNFLADFDINHVVEVADWARDIWKRESIALLSLSLQHVCSPTPV
jgi:hypothetical protein